MAREVVRVGRHYFVQTPNRWFPIESHTLFPGFQFLPIAARRALVRRFALGWMPRAGDAESAREAVDSLQLLGRRELSRLFPEALLLPERVAGLT